VLAGDQILRVDGQAVAASSDVIRTVQTCRVGDRVTIEVVRGGIRKVLRGYLSAMPSYEARVRQHLVGKTAPAFSVQIPGTAGGTLTPASLRGKVWLLEFWSTRCGACLRFIPFVKLVHQQYGKQGLEIVAIAKDTPNRLGQFLSQTPLPYTVGLDTTGAALLAYDIEPIPAFVLVDASGVVRDIAVGSTWPQDLQRLLGTALKLVAKPATTTP
jgi:peroxiredoxin